MSTFKSNAWYAVSLSAALGQEPVQRWIFRVPIVIFRYGNGQPTALIDVCPHRNAPLSMGKVVNGNIQCPYHGLQFSRSGRCVLVPGQTGTPASALTLKSFPVLDRYGIIWLWQGDQAHASPAALLDWPYHADPAYRSIHGELVVNAPVEMIVDNLMDLTHVHFVHKFGANILVHHSKPMKISSDHGRVSYSREIDSARFHSDAEVSSPEQYLEVGGCYRLPAVVTTHAVTKSVKTQQIVTGPQRFVIHALTPETDTRVRYVYTRSWNLRLSTEDVAAAATEDREALEEDKRIIEATFHHKQAIGPLATERLLHMDEAAVRARRASDKNT